MINKNFIKVNSLQDIIKVMDTIMNRHICQEQEMQF